MAAEPVPPSSGNKGVVGRVRNASISLINANPQLGMWQASGLAIAQAPNLNELRDPESGGGNIEFTPQGYSMRTAVEESDGELTLAKSRTRVATTELSRPSVIPEDLEIKEEHATEHHHHPHLHLHERGHQMLHRRQTLKDKHTSERKEKWSKTVMNGLRAFWKWFKTPAGFLITIYFLNIVAWGGMLFLLELKAAPAMNHPDKGNADSSPRKIWLEIDSQILNALFCVTGFGLAPWRFRDLYWFIKARHFHNRYAMEKLYKQNKAWFRPPAWATNEPDGSPSDAVHVTSTTNGEQKNDNATTTVSAQQTHRIDIPQTFTGNRAPPTSWWKLAFVIWMMVLNTLVQAVLCFFMWHYNRINRPVSRFIFQTMKSSRYANSAF